MANPINFLDDYDLDMKTGIFDTHQVLICCHQCFSWCEFASDWGDLTIPIDPEGHQIHLITELFCIPEDGPLMLFVRRNKFSDDVHNLVFWFNRKLDSKFSLKGIS